MNFKDSIQIYYSQRYIELLMVILIIGILSMFAMTTYKDYKKKALALHVFGADYIIYKNKSILYFAHNGKWPKDIYDAENFANSVGWATKKYEYLSKEPIKQVSIDNGAIHFILGYKNIGPDKTISIRPAVPANDIFGPVIWVCGGNRALNKWRVFGNDNTNFNEKYLSRFIK